MAQTLRLRMHMAKIPYMCPSGYDSGTMNSYAFWRASAGFWFVAFIVVVLADWLYRPYPHPMMVLLPPVVFSLFSSVQARRLRGPRKRD